MKRLTVVLLVLLSVIFSGCTAKMERMPGSLNNSQYAPTNSSQQSGLISYDSDSGDVAREDAYKQMYSACNGRYKIIGESKNRGDSVAMPLYGGGFAMLSESRIYIRFICD